MTTPANFLYDVYLSYAHQDWSVAFALAARLRKDGLRVWFDKEAIKPGNSFRATIIAGLEASRVLVLFMSAYEFHSEWTEFETEFFLAHDPNNKTG